MTYFITYWFSTGFTRAWSKALPLTPLAYFAALHPLLHVFGVARALETVAARRQQDQTGAQVSASQRPRRSSVSAAATRLSLPRAFAFGAVSLSAVGIHLMISATADLYPYGHMTCSPCECEGGVLKRCTVPAELGVMKLVMTNRGITSVGSNAFRGARDLIDTLTDGCVARPPCARAAGAPRMLSYLVTLCMCL